VFSWGRLKPIEPSPTAIVRHASALGRWEMALRDPHPALRFRSDIGRSPKSMAVARFAEAAPSGIVAH
jgi:hypothetical protein